MCWRNSRPTLTGSFPEPLSWGALSWIDYRLQIVLVPVFEVLIVPGFPYSSWPQPSGKLSTSHSSCTFISLHEKAFQIQYSTSFSIAIHRGCKSSFSQMLLLNYTWNLSSERREQILRLSELIKEVPSPLPQSFEVEDWLLSLWDGFWEGCRAELAGPFKMYRLLLDSNQSLKLQKTSNIIWSNSLSWRTQVLFILHYRWGNRLRGDLPKTPPPVKTWEQSPILIRGQLPKLFIVRFLLTRLYSDFLCRPHWGKCVSNLVNDNLLQVSLCDNCLTTEVTIPVYLQYEWWTSRNIFYPSGSNFIFFLPPLTGSRNLSFIGGRGF